MIGHDAVHQDLRGATYGDDDDHPNERNGRAAGEEENGLQRRAVAKGEFELKPLPLSLLVVTSPR